VQIVRKGKAWKFGDHIETEAIIPMSVIRAGITDPQKLAEYCMAETYPEFHKNFTKGDLIVAGRNFGCGHGLHTAAYMAFKALGVSAVIAESIGRDFIRTAIDFGLPTITCKDVTKKVKQGDELEVNLGTGRIRNLTTGEMIDAEPLPPILLERIEAGDLKAFLRKRLQTEAHLSHKS